MWPYLFSGDIILTKPVDQIKKGRLYMFSYDGDPVVHRFIGNLQFKGDFNKNCESLKGPVYVVEGRVFEGRFIDFKNPVSRINQIFIGRLTRLNISGSKFSKLISLSIQLINRMTRWLEDNLMASAKRGYL